MNQRRVASAAVPVLHQRVLAILPSVSLVVLTLMSLSEWPVPSVTISQPCLTLMAIFFFTLWQPYYVPFSVVFGCGLLYDAFQLSLFGTYGLLFLFFRLGVAWWRRYTGFIEQPIKHWLAFVLAAVAYWTLEWLFLITQLETAFLWPVFMERNALALALYPLLYYGLSSMIMALQSQPGV